MVTALVAPGVTVVKEWAYAGAFFVYSGAVVSHLSTGLGLGEVWVLSILIAALVASWALRPATRTLAPQASPEMRPLRANRHDRHTVQ
jgi:hypothetical protein